MLTQRNTGWVTTYKNLVFNDCGIGLDMTSGGAVQVVGSIVMQDSEFYNTAVGVYTSWSNTTIPVAAGSLVLDNVDMTGTTIAGINSTSGIIIEPGMKIDSFMQGMAYTSYFTSEVFEVDGVNKTCLEPGATGGRIQMLIEDFPARPALLTDDTDGKFVTRFKPQYEGESVSAFVSVLNNKYVNLVGDGITDDTAAMQQLFNAVDPVSEIVYFDHGAYVISDTIQVPSNIRITGEIWPMIMIQGSSSTFSDPLNPQPAWRIGNPGDTGNVEISEIVFETIGPAPGCIIVEWNMAGDSKDSAGK
jgi:glucan 1,3-beta-glucosidase